MLVVLKALASCLLPPILYYGTILLIVWEKRGQIEYIETSPTSFKIQFGKRCRQR